MIQFPSNANLSIIVTKRNIFTLAVSKGTTPTSLNSHFPLKATESFEVQ